MDTKILCTKHKRKITSICLNDNCDSPLMCMTCGKEHDKTHIDKDLDQILNNIQLEPIKELKQLLNQFNNPKESMYMRFITKLLKSLHFFQRLINKKLNKTVLDLKEKLHSFDDDNQANNMEFLLGLINSCSKNMSNKDKINYFAILKTPTFSKLLNFFKEKKTNYDNIKLSFENFSNRFNSEFSKLVNDFLITDLNVISQFKNELESLNILINQNSEEKIDFNSSIEIYSDNSQFLKNKRNSSQRLEENLKDNNFKNYNTFNNLLEKFIKENPEKNKRLKESQCKSFDINNVILSTIIPFSKSKNMKDKIIILLPMTIPGTGKLNFINVLLKGCKIQNLNFEILEDNKIIRNLDNSFNFVKPLYSDIDLFNNSGMCKSRFFNSLSHILNNQKKGNCVIYIDKNIYPDDAQEIIDFIKNIGCKDKRMKILALVPDCDFPLKLGNNRYPFSLSYFIQCFLRIKREINMNENLIGNLDSLIILANCFNNFKDFSFKSGKLIENKWYDFVLNLQFTEEITQNEIPIELVNLAIEFFTCLNDLEKLSKKFSKLLEDYGKNIKFEDCIKADEKNSKNSSDFLSKLFQ